MSRAYEVYGQQYPKVQKGSLFHVYCEKYTAFKLIGNITEKDCIDFACGSGRYSRRLKKLGANKVVGIDISKTMIQIAMQKEKAHPLGLSYLEGDCANVGKVGEFDFAFATYFLHYAQTKTILENFCKTIVSNLKPKSRFVTINVAPEIYPGIDYINFGQRNFYPTKPNSAPDGRVCVLNDGDEIIISLYNPAKEKILEVTNYFWCKETYEQALKKAGFSQVIWHPLQVAPECIALTGKDVWQDFLQYPCLIGLEAIL